MNGLALVIAVLLVLEPVDAPSAASIAAITGHGGIAAGLDASGALVVLRWPGPGGPNQMRESSAANGDGPRGGQWSIETGGMVRWLDDPTARLRQERLSPGSAIVVTTCEWPDGLSARQLSAVPTDRDLFVSFIEVRGTPTPPRLVWSGDFTPGVSQPAEIPVEGSALKAARGFAAFSDSAAGRVWNFRPERPGAEDWARARTLARVARPPLEWAAFGDGAWIGIAGAPVARHVSVEGSLGEAISSVEPGVESTDGVYRSWITAGIAENFDHVQELLDASSALSSAMAAATLPPVSVLPNVAKLDSALQAHALVHTATLQSLRDPKTGFTARGLEGSPFHARDWPRDGALVAWALFEAGDLAAAEASIEAYLKKVRLDDTPRKPFGSMPESLYTNGEPASAHFRVDDRGPARVLWVADRIVQARGEAEQSAWVRQHWKAIEAAAEFLSGWSDPRRGAPLYADDPVGLADGETQDRLFAAHAGMSAAIRLASYAGEPVPESWRNRQAQLLALAEWVLREPGRWVPGESLLLETDGLSAEVLGHVGEVCAHAIQSQTEREAVARLLLQQAILSTTPAAPSTMASALARIETTASGASATPDSLISAEVLLALVLSQ